MSALSVLFMIDNCQILFIFVTHWNAYWNRCKWRHVCWLCLYLPHMSVLYQRHHTLYSSLKVAAVICKTCLIFEDYILSTKCVYALYGWQKPLISLKIMQSLISVMEVQRAIFLLSADDTASIGRNNEWQLRWARRPQKSHCITVRTLRWR
jgi:hypothetical protein